VLAAPDKYHIQGLMFVTKNYGWKCFTRHLKDMQRNFGKPKLKVVAVIYCVRLNDRKLKTTIERICVNLVVIAAKT